MKSKREHFGACDVAYASPFEAQACAFLVHTWGYYSYPTMEGAIDALDPFQGFDLVGGCVGGRGMLDEIVEGLTYAAIGGEL